MPFTPAHAVVALPFLRTPLVPAAIAVAAMAPDIPLFFRTWPPYDLTHSWIGVVTIDLVIALFLLLVWQLVLRPAVIPLTPRWFALRWPREWLTDRADGWWSLWGGRRASVGKRVGAGLLLLASLALGTVSHVVWDAFTHHGRWGTELIPILAGRTGPFYTADVAHYVSSFIGLGIIAIWGFRWLRRQDVAPLDLATPIWARVAVWVALPVSLVIGYVIVRLMGDLNETRFILSRAGTTGAAIFLLFLAVSAVIVARLEARHARDAR